MNPKANNCSIVIVTHNLLNYTKQCLESIIKVTDYHPFELIVVDAHSTDGTLEYLRSNPEVKVVPLEKNYPYSYSLNRGIEAASGEYLCFINNDVIIVQSDWLKVLIQWAKSDTRIGIAGPRLCNHDLSVNSSGYNILPDGAHVPICPPDKSVTPCTYIMGACFLVKRQLIDQIGFFDERFFFSYDETDYCLRTWKAGWKVVCCTWSNVVHLVSMTSKTVTDKDYEYDIHNYENPGKRFSNKYSYKDFEKVLKEVKGAGRYYLWKAHYTAYKLPILVRKGFETIHTDGFRAFLTKMATYIFRLEKNQGVEED